MYSELPRFPYRIARELAEHILGREISVYDLVVLCELALMNPYPGLAFFSCLTQITKFNLSIDDCKQGTGTVENGISMLATCVPKHVFKSVYYQRVMDNVFGGKLREHIKPYVINMHRRALTMRSKFRFFIADAVYDNSIDPMSIMNIFHNYIGAPNFVYGNEYQGSFAINKTEIEFTPLLLVMGKIFESILYNKKIQKCPLYTACVNDRTPYRVNNECSCSFFKNAFARPNKIGMIEFCAGGAIVKSLGLEHCSQ